MTGSQDPGDILTEAQEAFEKQGHKKRVLVVDDQQSLRSVLGKMLTKAGYNVILAAHGAEASRPWRDNGPDLVIVDLFMPEKDGIETILELRARTPAIPIIAMSGGGTFQQVDVLQAARLLGAVATIEKPERASGSLRAGYCIVASQLPSSVTTPFGGPKSIRQRAVPDIDVPLTVPVKRESGVSMSKRTLFPSTAPSLTDPERTGADDVPRGPEHVS